LTVGCLSHERLRETSGRPGWLRKVLKAAGTSGGEEVLDGGGLPGVLAHVVAHGVAELVLADPRLEHGDDRAALAVGD
jgi:hypothetical protein